MGGVGLSAVRGARAVSAYPLIAIDRLDEKLTLACEVGATHTINALKEDPVEAIREIGRGGADYVFESVGQGECSFRHITQRGVPA